MQSTKLVKQLMGCPSMSLDEISELLGVSARTARAYVHDTNASLEGIATIRFSRRASGYRLEVSDAARLDAWLARMAPLEGADDADVHQERVDYLLNDLLSRNDWVTLADLASVLYVTPQRVSRDLKDVEAELARFGLSIEKRPRYGIRVAGEEMARRLCLASLASRATLSDLLGAKGEESQELLGTVTRCLEDVVEREGFPIGSLAFQNLAVHVYVALVRIRENCYVPMDATNFERIQGSTEYQVASEVACAIERETGITLPDVEVAYIAIHLAGKKTLNSLVFDGAAEDSSEGSGVISDGVWDVVSRMLDCVAEQFKFDFRQDLELRMNLARHLVPLSVRLKYHMRVENPILSDIRTRFPLAYSMALESGKVLEDTWGSFPSEEETGFIAMAFALALERQRTEMPKKNILVVCASGRGSARLLEARYRREFGDLIGSCTACDVASIGSVDFSTIDYVFTTVPLPHPVPVPVREVTYFLDSAEAAHIKQILGGSRDAQGSFRELDERMFFPHLACSSKEEVMGFLCDRVEEHRQVDADFREKIARREEAAPTGCGNLVAMPHPIEAVSDETFVCIGLLDHPVVWDDRGTEVQAVFLIFFSRASNFEQGDFFSQLADLFMNEEAMRTVIKHQDWQTFMSEFEGGR
ncbi:PRD domain-containing protein [Collinsella sp. An2]|uniref:BglG family transcription antiterminator n=1 Tax=Collinsella sp. An2 TaxID=1965585 RepID=UPI000B39688E|nr:PRD domain-containing protein [Collinsella sp. An2]OUP09529.1 hypothetical protein B5F33_05050 [Collinsella sp. An2]